MGLKPNFLLHKYYIKHKLHVAIDAMEERTDLSYTPDYPKEWVSMKDEIDYDLLNKTHCSTNDDEDTDRAHIFINIGYDYEAFSEPETQE